MKDEKIPIIIDSFGFWLKKDQMNGNFYCGLNNGLDGQDNLNADEKLNKVTNFSKHVWPRLIDYVPAMKKIEIIDVHEESYDYNLIDENGIVGSHPEINNIYFAIGFNGNHEIWSPALAKVISELIQTKRCNLINLDKLFTWQRILNSSKLKQRLSN